MAAVAERNLGQLLSFNPRPIASNAQKYKMCQMVIQKLEDHKKEILEHLNTPGFYHTNDDDVYGSHFESISQLIGW